MLNASFEISPRFPSMPSFCLDGRKALVTGASKGIGFAAAVALANAGARVTLAARSDVELELAANSIIATGSKCNYLTLDVTDSSAVSRLIAANGPFQILVNSAGMNRPKEIAKLTDEDIEAVLGLNVKANFYVTRAFVDGLRSAGKPGSIINVSSQMGLVGSARRTLYCASKHALEGLTKALAWELGKEGIRVNTICPTFIETEFTAEMFKADGFREWVINRIALGRLGQVEDLMGAFVFLASDASALMTGSALIIDGGWTAA